MAGTALIFDLDGTIWDSYPWFASVLGGGDPARRIAAVAQLRNLKPVARLLNDAGVTPARFRSLCDHSTGLKLYPGAAATLRSLSKEGTPIGVVTNLPAWIYEPMLACHKLDDVFDARVGARRGRPSKPHPAPLLTACGELGVEPNEDVWYVGDSPNDALAAAAAGLSFAWAAYGYCDGPPEGTEAVLNSVTEVLKLLKFLYKVWSNYDRFTPSQLSHRTHPGGVLKLGWSRYIESVDKGSEVWVYFHGRHAFENGVYAKGVADEIDVDGSEVAVRVREFSTTHPLTDAATSARIAHVVAARGMQVFLLPEYLDIALACDMAAGASTCARRHCGSCPIWQRLPLVKARTLGWPNRLPDELAAFAPGYWVVPPRNFIFQSGQNVKMPFRQTTELFNRFKTGEARLAFPLALAMREALADRGLTDFECVVPVPLSPDKEERGEIHRTRLLATELARLLGSRRRELLKLSAPISKRKLRGEQGYGKARFESAYGRRLIVESSTRNYSRVLLVDDVCTYGSTVSSCFQALRSVNPTMEVIATAGGQMTVKEAVRRPQDLIA